MKLTIEATAEELQAPESAERLTEMLHKAMGQHQTQRGGEMVLVAELSDTLTKRYKSMLGDMFADIAKHGERA